MRILTLAIALLLTLPTFAYANQTEPPPSGSSATRPAPADEYFGRLKMSILGIRNQLVHLTQRADEHPDDCDGILATALLTEESVKEWERHYPSDPWLDRTVYMLVHLYAKIPTPAGHDSARKALSWLLTRYPQSAYTNAAVEEVGEGADR